MGYYSLSLVPIRQFIVAIAMVTITEILELPVFADAKVVAGHGGVGKPIRWVHIVSMPDGNEYEWTKGQELILSVGYGLRDDPRKQRDVVRKMADCGIAGFVLSVEHYLPAAPTAMCEQADELGLPIIELPGDVRFVDVTEAVFARIAHDQYAVQLHVQAIHRQLTRIALDGGGLEDVLAALADFLDKSITIEDAAFEVLAHAQRGEVDEARLRSTTTGHSSPEIIERLIQSGTYDRLLVERRPVRVPPMPDVGLEMERIVAPIIVSRTIIGYMWIIAGGGQLTPLDDLAIEQAATIAALILYKDRAVNEERLKLRDDFFLMLLEAKDKAAPWLETQAALVDFRLDMRYQVLAVVSHQVQEDLAALAGQVERHLASLVKSFVVVRGNHIVVVLQTHQLPNGRDIAQALFDAMQHGKTVLLGVGTPVERVNGIATSYEQAREALLIGQSTEGRHGVGVVIFEDLGLLHWLQHVPRDALQDNWYYRTVVQLNDNDRDKNKVLLRTLEIFLDTGGNIKDTAERLFVHRNTLIYRLERIEAFTGVNLRDTKTQLNLSVALQAYRLRTNRHIKGSSLED